MLIAALAALPPSPQAYVRPRHFQHGVAEGAVPAAARQRQHTPPRVHSSTWRRTVLSIYVVARDRERGRHGVHVVLRCRRPGCYRRKTPHGTCAATSAFAVRPALISIDEITSSASFFKTKYFFLLHSLIQKMFVYIENKYFSG